MEQTKFTNFPRGTPMKKQTLLGAIALTTLAAAGAANAQQYTVVSSAVPTAATVKAARTVASEITLTGTNSKGVVGLAVTPSATAILPGGNSVLTFSLTGGHTFGTAVTPGAIVAGGTCAPTTTISTGGLATDSTVTFLISGLGGCDNGNPILAALPAALANNTSSLGVNTTFKTELGTAIDGGSASYSDGSASKANAVVAFAKAFKVTVVADTTTSAATLGNGFKSLTEGVLGTVAVSATTTAFAGIQAGAANVSQADITKADYKFVGAQSATAASLTFNAVAVPVTGLVSIATPAAGALVVAAVPVTPTASAAPIPASAYTVAVDLTLAAAYAVQPTFGPGALQSITREGSTYLIPWVSSGTLSVASGNSTVIRISNIGSAATGAVSAELLTSSAGVAASTALVPLQAAITKGGEAIITGQSLQTAIGADFGRGDVRITVEALPGGLVARRFIQNVANGSLTEVSLGRATGINASEPVN